MRRRFRLASKLGLAEPLVRLQRRLKRQARASAVEPARRRRVETADS